jgi:hypothetical protein
LRRLFDEADVLDRDTRMHESNPMKCGFLAV